MSSNENITDERRPTARLGDIEFAFEHPQLSNQGSGKYVQHEVLPLSEEDDRAMVLQPMGREARDWTLRGTCYKETANTLDDMIGTVVSLRHSRHSGDVYISDVSTDPQGVEDSTGWRYDYIVDLIEVV
jgi:hypothetical protein